MNRGVWIVSGWGLTVSGDVLISNRLANIIFGHDTQILLFRPVLCIAKKRFYLGVSGLCLGVSGGV